MLINLNYPQFILYIFSMFRAMGRFVWIPCYIVFFVCLYTVFKYCKKKTAIFVIVLCLIIQIIDFYPTMKNKFEYKEKISDLDKASWEQIIGDAEHIVYLNFENLSFDENRTSFYNVASIAYENNCTLNNFYFARLIDNVKETNSEHIERLKTGEIDNNTVYVIRQKNADVWWKENLYSKFIDGYKVIRTDKT